MKQVVYLTFNDPPSGIYSSQVIDVCAFMKQRLHVNVRLVAFISMRGFFRNRKKIKSSGVRSWVLPMFPRPKNWKLNSSALALVVLFSQPDVIIARGPYAASLALRRKNASRRIVFDGRGAYHAELTEYNVAGSDEMKSEIADIEKNVVLNSDFRIAVSKQLATYWSERYGYKGEPGKAHVVIPCTLSGHWDDNNDIPSEITSFKPDGRIRIIYAGSSSGWQSLKQLDDLLLPVMKRQVNAEIILLTPTMPANLRIAQEFPDRVKQKWLQQSEVQAELMKADYGWLVREKSVTNLVSSPVKFGEYLAAGLKVIISEGMGDNENFVRKHNAGIISGSNGILPLEPVSAAERDRMHRLATDHYAKFNYETHYRWAIGLNHAE